MKTDAQYDAIVVGAGHNGLSLALYLQSAGLQTLVLEREARCGGMAATDEPLLPGFLHNPHANFLGFYELMPVVRDFALAARGLRTVTPDAQHGIAFADGRPPVILYRPELKVRTRSSMAAHSSSDADRYLHLKDRAEDLGSLLAQGMFAPPHAEWFSRVEAKIDVAFAGAGLSLAALGSRSAASLIDELFESEAVRTLMYLLADEVGVGIETPGGALAFISFGLWSIGKRRLPIGGMGSLITALEAACRDEGVRIECVAPVERILVQDGRVVGVDAARLGTIKSARVVASAAPVEHTVCELAGSELFSSGFRNAVDALSSTSASTLTSSMFCLREPPSYVSARWNSDIDCCAQTFIGMEGPLDVLARARELHAGALPVPAGAVRVNTLFDPTQAPSGQHVAGVDSPLPPRASLNAGIWRAVAGSYNDALLDRWCAVAPNMTRENVLAECFFEPGVVERRVLLRAGEGQYRTEIDGLYLCGPGSYPGGGVHGAPAYNAYQVIAADLGLDNARDSP